MMVLALSGASVSAADLTGKVLLKGTAPKEIQIKMATDPRCAALHTEPAFTRFYQSSRNGRCRPRSFCWTR